MKLWEPNTLSPLCFAGRLRQRPAKVRASQLKVRSSDRHPKHLLTETDDTLAEDLEGRVVSLCFYQVQPGECEVEASLFIVVDVGLQDLMLARDVASRDCNAPAYWGSVYAIRMLSV